MIQKYGFTQFTLNEFEAWITKEQVARTVWTIQEHHTYIPGYEHFKGDNHFELQRGMQYVHKVLNGWADIAQHFSIFPDGTVLSGRNLEWNAACIRYNNGNAICIENVGNFDADDMRPEHREAVVRVTAALCKRFNIKASTEGVVYHHWFDLNTGQRRDGKGITKTCPGTKFFGGNSIEAAETNFLPLVSAILAPPEPVLPVAWYGSVTADLLNIRNAPSNRGEKVNLTSLGAILRIYKEQDGWLRISAKHEEWVYARYVHRLGQGVVTAKRLNVRTGPGTRFRKVDRLNKNEAVFVYQEQDGWLKISLDERWVSKRYVDLV